MRLSGIEEVGNSLRITFVRKRFFFFGRIIEFKYIGKRTVWWNEQTHKRCGTLLESRLYNIWYSHTKQWGVKE